MYPCVVLLCCGEVAFSNHQIVVLPSEFLTLTALRGKRGRYVALGGAVQLLRMQLVLGLCKSRDVNQPVNL